ncbi:MAG: asparagine synthase (glutamine-hydrolyzing) [Thiotrichales bacterium]|jgi:asparagine synthase (glutamine-hydrolysing)|nr:asparagine synthase (glutamine-hydrolyzing) [Thiotrichales bacterium]
MCGIAGFIGTFEQPNRTLEKMVSVIHHRGPDDHGVFFDENTDVGLAHARLSILDLSPAGHQPMTSNSGRYLIVFNGEIYNHLIIRNELEKLANQHWRGHSDTETLLAAIDEWGFFDTLKRLVGMFAIALYDRKSSKVYLARDRMGEKPLYYGFVDHHKFVFASELKSIKVLPNIELAINRDALALFLRHNYIPAPYSIYQGISKLEPGQYLTFSVGSSSIEIERYWSMSDIATQGMSTPFVGKEQEAIAGLDRVLKSSISQQMLADVPLGAFLSGGVDSSTVVALMQNMSSRPIKTFTIGFDDKRFNEAENAKAVAAHLGTEHTELYMTAKDALNVVPLLPTIYDEPFSDSSQIPTYLVSKLAKQHVTVSLSGDAGDELFSGYNRYTMTNRLWGKLSKVPLPIRSYLANLIRIIPPTAYTKLLSPLGMSNAGDKLHKASYVLLKSSVSDLYHGLVSHWDDPASVVKQGIESATWLTNSRLENIDCSDIERMMLLDSLSYLPDDILTKVDRAAMSVSLETRVPFLDHQVVEYAWSLPMSMKLRNHQGKWVLRQVLYQYVPKELIDRPKMGFGIPIDQWLRSELREWAECLLNEQRLEREGFFHPKPIREKWLEHLSGKRNWGYHLWDILVFQQWLETQ